MIHDNICNIENYKSVPKLYAALVALKQYVTGETYDENSIASFSKVKEQTRLVTDAQMENHHKYIDIHYVMEGNERILVTDSTCLIRKSEFSEENDCELFDIPEEVKHVDMKAGDFLVVYPGEAHTPQIAVGDETKMISKVVVKYA